MNKYSSKAIKTAATVGMSLAMVLSAVPAVGNVTNVQAATVCTTKKSYAVDSVYTTKTIKGAKTLAEVKAEAEKALKGMELTKTKEIGKESLEYYLGYKADTDAIPTKITDVNNISLSITSKVTYGYYASEDMSVVDHAAVKENDPLKDSEVVIEVRSNAEIGKDINDYVKATIGKEWSTDAAISGKVNITNQSGVSAQGDVKAVYSIDGAADVDATNPVGNVALDTSKEVVVKIVVATAFDDFSNCAEQGTGLGITDRYTAKNVYNEIVSAFDKATLTFENVKPGDKVEFTKTNTASLGEVTILSKSTRKLDVDFKAVLRELAKFLDNTTDEGKAVERLLDIDSAMDDMFKAGGNLAKAEKYDEDTEFKTTSAYAAAAELLEDFNDFDTYLTNLNDTDYDRVTAAKSLLEDLVSNYVAENDGDLLDKYLTNLDKFYEKFVDQYGDAGITKANVDAAIKQIKNGVTFTDLKGKTVTIEKSEYTTFKNNSGVEEYMTKFEDMYDEIQAVKEAVANANEAYKDLIKDGSDSVRSFLKGKEFKTIKSKITLEDYKILKAYKEEVLDAVLTLETKEVGNSYVNKSTKSIYATTTQLNTVLNNISNGTDLDKGVFTKLDKEEGEFNWDKLVKHMEKVEASLEAITTNIEKLDAVSLTVNDRAAILAADDAVYFLTDDGAGNLTKAETRTVKNADRKVTELMEAYRKQFGSLNVELNSWVNKGNGDWAYYENGNAVTKWVASGSDWYYVKGGVMLRNSWIASDSQGTKWYYVDDAGKMVSNTTVNGYTFNSYGVWVK